MRERMGWGRLEVCDPLRSLQMSVCRLCWAGPASVFDMCRREANKPEPPASTLRVPQVPQLIPLYPGEAGCQV